MISYLLLSCGLLYSYYATQYVALLTVNHCTTLVGLERTGFQDNLDAVQNQQLTVGSFLMVPGWVVGLIPVKRPAYLIGKSREKELGMSTSTTASIIVQDRPRTRFPENVTAEIR